MRATSFAWRYAHIRRIQSDLGIRASIPMHSISEFAKDAQLRIAEVDHQPPGTVIATSDAVYTSNGLDNVDKASEVAAPPLGRTWMP
jgi:hypothetical protein